jgi:hypothetical protein
VGWVVVDLVSRVKKTGKIRPGAPAAYCKGDLLISDGIIARRQRHGKENFPENGILMHGYEK